MDKKKCKIKLLVLSAARESSVTAIRKTTRIMRSKQFFSKYVMLVVSTVVVVVVGTIYTCVQTDLCHRVAYSNPAVSYNLSERLTGFIFFSCVLNYYYDTIIRESRTPQGKKQITIVRTSRANSRPRRTLVKSLKAAREFVFLLMFCRFIPLRGRTFYQSVGRHNTERNTMSGRKPKEDWMGHDGRACAGCVFHEQ